MPVTDLPKRMTIGDIARLAGVARSTVSEVVNNDPKSRVSRKPFEKVRRIIDEYDYVPSPQARALTTRKTRQLGFLVSATATLGLANSYFSLILAGIEKACTERDYRCLVSRYDLSQVENFVTPPELRQRSIDGLIIAGILGDSSAQLKSLGIPIGVVGVGNDDAFFQIDRDIVGTYGEAFRYLAKEGHRCILLPYLGDVELQELRGAVEACNAELKEPLIPVFISGLNEENEFDHGTRLAELVLSDPRYQECTALLANDQICCGFMCRMHRSGKRFPDDFSVVSHNDSPACQWNTIPITSCGAAPVQHGYIMASRIIDLLEEKKSPGEVRGELRKWHIPLPLTVRESSGKAPSVI